MKTILRLQIGGLVLALVLLVAHMTPWGIAFTAALAIHVAGDILFIRKEGLL